MPIKKEIVYPFFLECSQFADDIFWENIFENLAYGKAPYGTYINKGFLCCSFKNKEFSYKIERKQGEILYKDIYKLLTEKIGILSHKEKLKKRLDFHELEKNIKNSRQDWCNIKRKNIKDIMYEKYAIDMKIKHGLTLKQTRNLLAVIFISIMFKTITTKDIIYKDDKIQNIKGINFEKGKVIIDRPLCLNETKCLEDNQILLENYDIKNMSNHWEEYLNNLRILNN